ncbi:MAG: threonylcarbamoyl-AMP synthase [Myxococcales bacterium]|nr:threonylcarbamoyl-AMP synthase [Myxococcales bacterium]
MRLEINPHHPQPHKIGRAASALRAGGVVAYPTDSTYAIGCDLNDKKAIDTLYRIKNMPKHHPLTILCADLANIATYALVDNPNYRLIKRLIPGPYCFILPATRQVPKLLMRKRKQVGIRVPDHPVTQALLAELGHPIVSSTAAIGGETLQDPADIDTRLSGLALVLDADLGRVDPSTIVDLTGDEPEIVRYGVGDASLVC